MFCLVAFRQPDSTGEASFSCLIDGAVFSSNGTDGMANATDAYNAESGSATITSISATRIEGTFSGIFSGMGKTFKVTNGKFDLPASKYSPPLQ